MINHNNMTLADQLRRRDELIKRIVERFNIEYTSVDELPFDNGIYLPRDGRVNVLGEPLSKPLKALFNVARGYTNIDYDISDDWHGTYDVWLNTLESVVALCRTCGYDDVDMWLAYTSSPLSAIHAIDEHYNNSNDESDGFIVWLCG